jgi:peroxiredoxin Q/BCP
MRVKEGAMAELLEVGAKAPSFSTIDQNGEKVKLGDFKGRPVVLFFYPKDDTPGCTREACGFRDAYAEIREAGAEVLGVSVDGQASHKKFAEKFDLPYRLLVDDEKKIVEDYGVWGEKKNYGKTYMGTHRVTYVVDGNGKIAAVYPKVKPDEHAAEILAFVDGGAPAKG